MVMYIFVYKTEERFKRDKRKKELYVGFDVFSIHNAQNILLAVPHDDHVHCGRDKNVTEKLELVIVTLASKWYGKTIVCELKRCSGT